MYRPRDKQTREKHVISVNDRLWLIGDLARLSFSANHAGVTEDRSIAIGSVYLSIPDRAYRDRSLASTPLIRDRIINVGRIGARRLDPRTHLFITYTSD